MRKVIAASAAIAIVLLVVVPSASAFEGGGRNPSEAPLVTVGQHYTGQLNNHKDDANYGGFREVAIYRLPPVTTRDVVTVDWHAAPFTDEPGSFPVCLYLAQGIDDFNWGSVFDDALYNSSCYALSGSGSARSEIVVQETSSASYLEFFDHAERTSPSDYETFPYDFSVEPILHYLAAAIPPVKRVSASGILRATANLATGAPAPDGLPFSLSVTWEGGGVASYTALSSSGTVSFQLALPETAYGKQATFVASHPADGTYQGVTTAKVEALVAKPKPPPPSPCLLAERRELPLAKQFKRLKRHAGHARGAARRALNRRVRQAKRKLRAARAETAAAC
jgi:hypothetical protein